MLGQVEPVEGPPIFLARELLPENLLRTDFYSVSQMVEVTGFAYEFSVESVYGNYRVTGKGELLKLLHELEVIGQLAEISQSEAFASSLSTSFTDPVATTVGVARRPIASVTGLPTGIARYLGGKLYQVRRGSDKAVSKIRSFKAKGEEVEADSPKEKGQLRASTSKLSRKHLGHDSAKRKWARRLEVDPYSDNLRLQEALGRIAWASSLGQFAGDFAVPSSEVFSYAGKAQELVWDRPAHQLEREIVGNLKKCKVDKYIVEAFRDSSAYSLTEKTQLSLAFLRLKESGAVPFLVEFALEAKTKEDAFLFLRTMGVFVQYQEEVSEIVDIQEKRGLLVASSKNGYEIYPLAVDYLHWTPLVYEALLSEELKSDKREVWVSGTVSPIAKLRLRHHGWEVFDEVER